MGNLELVGHRGEQLVSLWVLSPGPIGLATPLSLTGQRLPLRLDGVENRSQLGVLPDEVRRLV